MTLIWREILGKEQGGKRDKVRSFEDENRSWEEDDRIGEEEHR